MKKLDLHVHSTASDGRLTPRQLVVNASGAGYLALAITDHDTLDGLPEAMAAAGEESLRLIPAVELSVDLPGDWGTAHLLGYFPKTDLEVLLDPANRLTSALERVVRGRRERNPRILEKLAALGMRVPMEEVTELAGEGVLGRPHIAAAMLARGYVSSTREAFERFLARDRPAYVERERLTIGEAFEVITMDVNGGFAVLAHPGLLPLSGGELSELVRELTSMGLMGLEVYYPRHSPTRIRLLRGLASDLDLMVTGGSDFHGLPEDSSPLGGDEDGFTVDPDRIRVFLRACGGFEGVLGSTDPGQSDER